MMEKGKKRNKPAKWRQPSDFTPAKEEKGGRRTGWEESDHSTVLKKGLPGLWGVLKAKLPAREVNE